MTQACEAGGYPPPAWRELGAALRVIFEPHPEVADAESELNDVPDVPIDVPVNEVINETGETKKELYEPVNEPVNEANEPVNEPVNTRQQWFIAQIVAGRQPGWADLAQQWQVSRATARRDITDLKTRGLIEFVGTPKTGFYRLTKQA